jgi:hypothetical protein
MGPACVQGLPGRDIWVAPRPKNLGRMRRVEALRSGQARSLELLNGRFWRREAVVDLWLAGLAGSYWLDLDQASS